jgi:hypothetical protein
MHYLISGLAKSGTTRLFAQLQRAIAREGRAPQTAFEPHEDDALKAVLAAPGPTLTKVLIGRVKADSAPIADFDRHVLIYRDPRDQFLSTLLYFFYDFQVNGDLAGYRAALSALEAKVADPEGVSTIDLYSDVAKLAGRAPIGVFRRLHAIQNDFESAFGPFRLRYESLVAGNGDGDGPDALENYLGLTIENDAVQVPDSYARVARSRGYGEWRRWFNAADIAFSNREWGEQICRLGYALAGAPSALYIDPASSLDYVRQFEPTPPLNPGS